MNIDANTDPAVAAAWRKYKNRKKTLRQKYRGRELTPSQQAIRERELDEARDAYMAALPPDEAARFAAQTAWRKEAKQRGDAYLAEGGNIGNMEAIETGDCDAYCVGAKERQCDCACIGVNHGAANGIEPWQVTHQSFTLAERIAADLLPPETPALRAAERAEAREHKWQKTKL